MSDKTILEYLRIYGVTSYVTCISYAQFYEVDMIESINRIHLLNREGYLDSYGFEDGYPSYRLSTKGHNLLRNAGVTFQTVKKQRCPHCGKAFYDTGSV